MTTAEIYQIISEIAALSVVVPITISLIRIRALNHTLWALFFYLLACIAAEGAYLKLQTEEDSNRVMNGFTILEFTTISFIYFNELRLERKKYLVLVSYLIFMVVAVKRYVYDKQFGESDNIVSSLESGFMIIISGLFFYRLVSSQELRTPGQYYFYWINLSFLLYFSAALILFLFYDYIEHSPPATVYILWGLHQLLNITTSVLMSIGIWKSKARL